MNLTKKVEDLARKLDIAKWAREFETAGRTEFHKLLVEKYGKGKVAGRGKGYSVRAHAKIVSEARRNPALIKTLEKRLSAAIKAAERKGQTVANATPPTPRPTERRATNSGPAQMAEHEPVDQLNPPDYAEVQAWVEKNADKLDRIEFRPGQSPKVVTKDHMESVMVLVRGREIVLS